MVGEGKERPALEAAIRSWGLENICELLPYTHDLAGMMSRSHCLLLPSVYEGLPLVVLEAGACAVPVLATPGANSCGLLNGSNSFVVDIQQFASTAKEIMDNYDDALTKSARLQVLVRDHFSVEAAYAELIDAYRFISN
jgi:glycosyltransferase involved in cell wall biosynthesis